MHLFEVAGVLGIGFLSVFAINSMTVASKDLAMEPVRAQAQEVLLETLNGLDFTTATKTCEAFKLTNCASLNGFLAVKTIDGFAVYSPRGGNLQQMALISKGEVNTNRHPIFGTTTIDILGREMLGLPMTVEVAAN